MKTGLVPLFAALVASTAFSQVPYPGNDSDHGVTRPAPLGELIHPYTGNASFGVRDLTVAGAVGRQGLSWSRDANSRTTQSRSFFGLGHNWTHNWQWEMVDAGRDAHGRAVLSVREPSGWVHRFTETSPGAWWSAPSVRDRVVSEGDTFRLLRFDASEVRFTRLQTSPGAVFVATEVLDSNGAVVTLAYDADGQLARVTEPAGRWIEVSYAALAAPTAARGAAPLAVISQVTASDGQTVAYTYEFPQGVDYPVLSGAVYADGTKAAYAYEAPRPRARLLLTAADDPHAGREVRGRKFRYRTDPGAAAGHIAEVSAAGSGAVLQALGADPMGARAYAVRRDNGATVYRRYLAGGNVAEEIDALGFAKRFDYDADGRGFLIATTDELGRVTRRENGPHGMALRQVWPDGAVSRWERDERGRLLAETNELGQTKTYTRDEQGRVRQVEHPDGSVEETAYDAFGQIVMRIGRDGAKTVIDHDERGRRTRVTNALGQATTYAYDARDRLAATTDALGHTTRFARDAAGRVVKTTFADGSSTGTAYDAFGQTIQTVDALGAVRTMVYDGFGRMVATSDALGNVTTTIFAKPGETEAPFSRPVRVVSPTDRTTATAYDAAGRVVARTVAAGTREAATTRFTYDAAGRQSGITDPRGKTGQFFHDERGRRVRTMTALNHASTITYDAAGRKLSATDAKGNTTRWTHDTMGRELTKTDALGQTTSRAYDATGRLVALTDAKGNTYRFEHDMLGRPTALVYPDGSRETTSYDEVGRKRSFTNRAGTTRTFAYDDRNREIASEWSDGSQRIVKAYDEAGRMTLEDNGVSRIAYAYDEAGRLASETQDLTLVATDGALDPEPRTVRYTYDADGRRATLGHPDGTLVRQTYNARGQLAEVWSGDLPPPLARYEYDAAGNAVRMPRENATETEREFDAENKTVTITERALEGGGLLGELDYTYDEVGNRTASLATHDYDGDGRPDARLDSYRYDATYQATGADYAAPVSGAGGAGLAATGASPVLGPPAATVRYTYDAVGNRLAVDESGLVTRYAVNPLNQYIQVGQFAPSHDRNGNLASLGRWLYRFDVMNRLTEATDGATTARFFYDARNRVVARRYQRAGAPFQPPVVTLTLNTYDNWNLIEERDGAGAPQARYVHGRRIDEILVMVNRRGTFYPHHDALGNVTLLTGQGGRLVERYAYSVTGQVTVSDAAGRTLAGSAAGNRWMFTGREWLPEVGLYDYRNRIYSADLGRFLQTDPIRLRAGDKNFYRYVSNRVLARTDPSGLVEILIGIQGSFVAGVGGTLGAGIFIDTDTPANSGFYGNYGPSIGGSLSLGLGILVGENLGGWGNTLDANVLAGSGTLAFNSNLDISGAGVSIGPGVGGSFSASNNVIFSAQAAWNTAVIEPSEAANELEYAATIMQGNEPNPLRAL